MIVCSCNVLSDDAIRSCLDGAEKCPRTPGQVQRCLGRKPQCGACFPSIRAILIEHAHPELAAKTAA